MTNVSGDTPSQLDDCGRQKRLARLLRIHDVADAILLKRALVNAPGNANL